MFIIVYMAGRTGRSRWDGGPPCLLIPLTVRRFDIFSLLTRNCRAKYCKACASSSAAGRINRPLRLKQIKACPLKEKIDLFLKKRCNKIAIYFDYKIMLCL